MAAFPAHRIEEGKPFCNHCPKCAALFDGLSEGKRAWVNDWLQQLPQVKYAAGEKIIREHLPAFGLYLVCKGRVKVVQHKDGPLDVQHKDKEQIFKFVGPGEMLGEESLFGDGLYAYYAEAVEPVEARFIHQSQLDALLQHCPTLLRRLTQKLALEVKALQGRLMESSFYSCKEKIARILLSLTGAYGTQDAPRQLDLTRADLAKMCGISVETAIRTLSDFESRGWIGVHYHTITLHRPEQLEKLANPLKVDVLEHVM